MRLLIVGFLFLVSQLNLSAIETAVQGNLPGAENLEIRLTTYSDLVTYSEKILDRQIVDESGNFNFSIDLKETIIAYLDIEFYTYKVFLEPGKKYELNFAEIKISVEYRPYYQKEELNCILLDEPQPGLNQLISDFDNKYNQFLLDNFENIYRRRNKIVLDNFKTDVSRHTDTIENPYYCHYCSYKIASLELVAASFDKEKLFNEYIQNQPVEYKNTEYMYFLNQFFEKYLSSVTRAISRADLQGAINQQNSYKALLDILGKDTLLRNERIREIVMMRGLKEFYYSSDYLSNNVIDILNQAAELSRYPENRLIAANIGKSILHLRKGTDAPDFSSLTLEGDTVKLSDFNGELVYLSFMNTWSFACLGEFKFMDSLYMEYGQDIKFITVSFDKDMETIKKFVKEKNYNWTFLFNGTHYDLMKDYELKTFPVFVLISPEGKILQYPAYKPSETIEEAFVRLTR